MAGNRLRLRLHYLIEGNKETSYISVPYLSDGQPTEVEDLRQIIFEKKCKDLAPDADNLILFKVRILLPLLLSD